MRLATSLLMTINGTANLFCRFGMLKSKITIPIIFISVLFVVLKVKFGDLFPTNFSIESIWMSLNSVFNQSKFTRLIVLPVSHSPSKFLSFKIKFIMGLYQISLTNFICWFGFRGYHTTFQNSKISYFSLILLMLQCSHQMFYSYRCPKFYTYSNDKVWHYIFGNEINLQLLFQSFYSSNNNRTFQYYLHFRLLRSRKK